MDDATYLRVGGNFGTLAISNGTIYVTNGNSIGVFYPNFTVYNILVGNSYSQGYINGVGSSTLFSGISDIAMTSSGDLFVADTYNRAIRRVTPTGFTTTFAGNGNSGILDGHGSSATFNGPQKLSIDANDNLYVLDGSYIRKVTPSGNVTSLSIYPYIKGMVALAVSKFSSFLLIATTNKVYNVSLFNSNVCASGYYCTSQSMFPCPQLSFSDKGQRVCCGTGSYYNGLTESCTPCPAGTSDGYPYYASNPATLCQPCAIGFYQPFPGQSTCVPCPISFYSSTMGSTQCTTCPANTTTPYAGATSPSECSSNFVSSSTTKTVLLAGTNMTAGSPCATNTSCASGLCLSGACCSLGSVSLGCSACSLQTGACLTQNPGAPCNSPYDCASGACLGGCCCTSTALFTPGCTACKCLGNSTASTSIPPPGSCGASSSFPLGLGAQQAYHPQCPVNSTTTSIPSPDTLSRLIAFPPTMNVTEAQPVLILSALSPLNVYSESF